MTRSATFWRLLPLSAVTFVTLLTLTVLFSTDSGRRELRLSFTSQPAAFTELYFSADIPVAETRQDLTSVHFSIRNQERMTTRYDYVVTARRDSTAVSTRGSVVLRVGEKADLSPTLQTRALVWQRVNVVLENRSERISWRRTSTNELVGQ